jgi:hypothetical protein
MPEVKTHSIGRAAQKDSARASLRVAACLQLAGQLLYIAVTQLHAGGDANNHRVIFAIYAANDIWTAVHLGQFASMVILLAGLFALFVAMDARKGAPSWTGRFGAAVTVATLALYGVLQAVDGVALKQAVNAWSSAPEAEKMARFASAETIRWLEWGMRSYENFAIGLALILCAAAATRTLSRPMGGIMGLSGIAYLAQGWIAGGEGFSPAQSTAIIAGWALSLLWMIWLAAISARAD